MKKVISILLLLFLTTGCYNYRELNEIAIVSAIGINKTDNGFEVVAQVLNTQKQGTDSSSSGELTKFIVYKQKGKTIQEALHYAVLESPKKFYTSHMSLLLISEEIANENLPDILEYFARDSEVDKQFLILITKKSETDDVMETLTALETLNAKNIKDSLMADQNYLGASKVISFEDLLEAYLNKRKDIMLPTVIIKGDKKEGEKEDNLKESNPAARIFLDDVAIYDENKIVGFLEKKDSINASILNNDLTNTIYSYECDDNKYIDIKIVKTDSKVKTNNLDISINITQQATINESNCKINLRDEKAILEMENKIEKAIEKDISKTLATLQDHNADVIGYEDLLYKNKPKIYKNLKQKYEDDLFKNFHFKVNVDLNLYAKGNILKEI